jgi:hypothetical protein
MTDAVDAACVQPQGKTEYGVSECICVSACGAYSQAEQQRME